ncbi:hypothetical protein ACFOKI_02910 [Sphingomonas qilianensis]|uniref:Uncharacterized protein n=1 Tax=Sphingomonas qilianensis TaxID=1736690 RepID=A0ABU9XVL6_9SPHN
MFARSITIDQSASKPFRQFLSILSALRIAPNAAPRHTKPAYGQAFNGGLKLDEIEERSTLIARTGTWLDRIEFLYLRVLRAMLLVGATVLLICALVWAATSVTRILRSPDSVAERPSVVSANELQESGLKMSSSASSNAALNKDFREQRSNYDSFLRRYYSLYRTRYQPNLRTDDKTLAIGEFDDLTINSSARLASIRKGELDFAVDKKDLDTFLPVIVTASSSKSTDDRLSKYRLATKKPVATQVQRTRTETRRGWDPYSENCPAWYESPIGCAVNRQVVVPYSETVKVMRYPDGIASPNEILKSYQDRYFGLLAERRRTNADKASSERQDIVAGQATGWGGLSQSVMIVGAFLVLMFFFLLVAIERHQRRIAALLP